MRQLYARRLGAPAYASASKIRATSSGLSMISHNQAQDLTNVCRSSGGLDPLAPLEAEQLMIGRNRGHYV
ncbi:hypothetical protein ACCS80_38495, partial [Rhizobium ruizarguesonis]